MTLTDKVAVVFGGSGGLGSHVASRLAGEGAKVYATYHSKPAKIQVLKSSGRSITMIQTDVKDDEQVTGLFDRIIGDAGSIHIVVNSVGGYLPPKPLTDVSVDEWDRIMETNLRSVFLSMREALRRMRGQSYGRIINISAMTGLRPSATRIPYSISKASVSLLTDLASEDVKGTGITINAIAPSIIATASNLTSMHGDDSSLWVTPDQIADLILFLCSPGAGAITGTTIKASGGV